MRPSCLDCSRKHIAEAEVLWRESMMGYPEHVWLAIAHLSQAEAELLDMYPIHAHLIRQHRLALIDIRTYRVPTLTLIRMLTDESEKVPGSGVSEGNTLVDGILPHTLEPPGPEDTSSVD